MSAATYLKSVTVGVMKPVTYIFLSFTVSSETGRLLLLAPVMPWKLRRGEPNLPLRHRWLCIAALWGNQQGQPKHLRSLPSILWNAAGSLKECYRVWHMWCDKCTSKPDWEWLWLMRCKSNYPKLIGYSFEVHIHPTGRQQTITHWKTTSSKNVPLPKNYQNFPLGSQRYHSPYKWRNGSFAILGEITTGYWGPEPGGCFNSSLYFIWDIKLQ